METISFGGRTYTDVVATIAGAKSGSSTGKRIHVERLNGGDKSWETDVHALVLIDAKHPIKREKLRESGAFLAFREVYHTPLNGVRGRD